MFGWGWLLAEQGPAVGISLELEYENGGIAVLRCQQAGTRPDLAEAYPDFPHAIGAGFLVQGRLRADCPIRCTTLAVRLADGSEAKLPLPGFPDAYLSDHVAGRLRGRWPLIRDLLARGDWRRLAVRAWSMSGRFLSGLRRRLRALQGLTAPGQSCVLIFDHAMGGGANHFRREQVKKWLASGQSVLLVTPHLPSMSYELVEMRGDSERISRYNDLSECLAALPRRVAVVVNSLVSYDDPLLVVDWVVGNQDKTSSCFYLHDYHAACPVWTLVSDEGVYCGIPALDRCRRCLQENDAPFLALMPSLDVGSWRQKWAAYLADAGRIVAFSATSVAVLRKAFPELPSESIRVEPHDTGYIRHAEVAFDLRLPLTIAVVGHINAYKGAAIVAEMVQIIENENLPARVVVIGTIDNLSPSPALRITGSYRGEDLPALLSRERAGICLLPSICHETFSFVTAELMAYRMPLAVFDLGAPAERVRGYDLGRIIPEVGARAAIDTVFQLREELLAAAGSRCVPPPADPQ